MPHWDSALAAPGVWRARGCVGGGASFVKRSQRLQYPLIEEYTLNLIRVPIAIQGYAIQGYSMHIP